VKKKSFIGLAALAVILVVVLLPPVRTAVFVRLFSGKLEEAGVTPIVPGIQYVNEWGGEHYMKEYVLGGGSGHWWGCYYSPSDLPLAFQNVPAELKHEGNSFTWEHENRKGSTYRLRENWYYFEAERK